MSFRTVPWSYASRRHPIESHLGEHLRAMYGRLPMPPVPDRISALLRQLDTVRSETEARS